ncbi:MAG: serine/threonine-protein kinase, partial [Pseudomonadota bacterium]
LRRLGRGGTGGVYLADQVGPMGFTKRVALKVVRSEDDEVGARSLVNEARIGGRLSHPNVVETHGFGEAEGRLYLILEYVPGDTLYAVLKELRLRSGRGTGLPPTVVCDIFLQVLAGLDYAHRAVGPDGESLDVVHRDLKPGNLMVRPDGRVKILDFGVVHAATNLYRTTHAGDTKGTPPYMSPEQTASEPLDGRSDLFAVGSMLYECLVGTPLFVGETALVVMSRVQRWEPDHRLERPEIPRPLRPVLMRLLAPTAAGRYPTAELARQALLAARADLAAGPSLAEWLDARRAKQQLAAEPTRVHDRALPMPAAVVRTAVAADFEAVAQAVSDPRRTAVFPAPRGRFVLATALGLVVAALGVFALPGGVVGPATTGAVELHSVPAATVTLDGVDLGRSPIRAAGLATGDYRAVFACVDCAEPTRKEVPIRVHPDETTRLVVRLDEP